MRKDVLTPEPAPRRDYSAELNGIMAKAMAAFEAGKLTSLEVIKLEDHAENLRLHCIAKGLI